MSGKSYQDPYPRSKKHDFIMKNVYNEKIARRLVQPDISEMSRSPFTMINCIEQLKDGVLGENCSECVKLGTDNKGLYCAECTEYGSKLLECYHLSKQYYEENGFTSNPITTDPTLIAEQNDTAKRVYDAAILSYNKYMDVLQGKYKTVKFSRNFCDVAAYKLPVNTRVLIDGVDRNIQDIWYGSVVKFIYNDREIEFTVKFIAYDFTKFQK